MAHFTYTAERESGDVYHGVADAANRFEVYQIIRREGGHLIDLQETKTATRFLSLGYWNAFFSSVPEQERMLFTRNLGSMLAAGLPLSRALSVIERQTRNSRLRSAVSDIAADVRHGDPLNAALAKFPNIFSKLVVAMVRAGEEGGDLSSSLLVSAEQMERAYELKKKIRGALIYPAIILMAIVGIGALMMINVVPTLAKTFEELHADLPLSTRVIIFISNFLVHYTLWVLAGLMAIGVGIYAGIRTAKGKRALDYFFLHIPIIGVMVREVNAARTARTLAALLAAGVDVLTSLGITRDVVQNVFFQDILGEAVDNVGKGQALSATFVRHEYLYPPFVGEMMAVGEETGQTTEMMKHLALFYEEEVDRKTKNLSTIIEPFIMIIIGSVVGFFAVSMITPIYQLSSSI